MNEESIAGPHVRCASNDLEIKSTKNYDYAEKKVRRKYLQQETYLGLDLRKTVLKLYISIFVFTARFSILPLPVALR